MINFRKNPIDGRDYPVKFIEGETIKELVSRSICEMAPGAEVDDKTLQAFSVTVNGHLIPHESWESFEVKEKDQVLIVPMIRGGDFGQIFGSALIIGAALVSGGVLAPALSLSGFAAGALTAGVTFATTLIVRAVIPPPDTGLGLGTQPSSIENSQMYTITSQSNQTKKYQNVPKTYGYHRVFPNIAANPYTTVENDPETGELVQYFHAIYDFGYGPHVVDNIQIGDTPINSYNDVEYRLVDPNRPSSDEGEWDRSLFSSFEIYKGDNEKDNTRVNLNFDSSPTRPEGDYRVIRQTSSNVQGDNQEVILDFVCNQGLYALATNGDIRQRTIDLSIEFRKVGTSQWRSFNDLNFVDSFKSVGGDETEERVTLDLYDSDYLEDTTYYSKIFSYRGWEIEYPSNVPSDGYYEGWGIEKGSTQFIVDGLLSSAVGSSVFSKQAGFLGKIQSTVSISGPSTVVTLDRPVSQDILVYTTILDSSQTLLGRTEVYTLEDNREVYYTFIRESGATISRASRDPVYSTFSFKPKELGPFEVRITRLDTYSDVGFRTFDDLTLYQLSNRFDRDPIRTDKRHTFMEVKIKATNQLNGTIQDLSANLFSVLEVYDGSNWVKQATNNPAWVFADLLTGEVNPRAISKDRLDTDSLLDWANYCDEVPASPTGITFVEPRFTCNFVLDFDTTLAQVIEKVCNAAQSSMNIVEGNYGVLLDKAKNVPVQIFTPRNSSNFNSSRSYAEQPHALKIRFVDPDKNWDVSERIVYDDGYDQNTATDFDELSTFACTNSNQAWRFGRYMLAQGRLRQETISINVDFENLVCTRGDYVVFTQDAMKVGGSPARVSSVSGSQVTIDDGLNLDTSLSLGYTYRDVEGNFHTDTLSVIDSDTFDLDGDIPDPGDLIVIGEVGSITFDCIVKSITPQDELSAEITLVEKADAIFDAESTTDFTEYDPFLTSPPAEDVAPGPVQDLEVVENTYRVRGEAYEYYIDLDWENPLQGTFQAFEVYADRGNGLKLYETTENTFSEYIVDPGFLGIEHEFRVLAVSPTGAKIPLIEAPSVTATPLRKTERPDDVPGLFIDITNEVLELNWPDLDASDVDEFLIRFSPLTEGATWETSTLISRISGDMTSHSVQARVGTYLIKAIDFEGNQSLNPARAVTSIPELFELNFIETINDAPDYLGVKEQIVEDNSDALVLQNVTVGGVATNEYYPEGFYYYENFLDLGQIYSVRLQSAILAEGFTVEDLMENWVTLSDVEYLSNSRFSEWDVETQVRYTNDINVLSDWPSLDVIDRLDEGFEELWTDWKTFKIGDFTGRIFQFRLRLLSKKASVTPRVFDAEIKADMPDRQDVYNNIISSVSGTDVVFDTPFKGPDPLNIQITQDNAQNGDYYQITNRSLSKFTITFYDSADNPVSRQFDAAVRGYGRKQNSVS